MRAGIWLGELVDQVLAVGDGVGDDSGEVAVVLRIVAVEALGDEVGEFLVLGEDDGLAKAITTSNAVAASHEDLESFVDSVGVEKPLVDCL
ncbi:Uncharacterised protein [Mycobacteroides abscessus subsp. abscessus]|nr:Uncharacterised protein [Mycobacteroides abscessus subsp. abscessus]